MKIKIDKNSDFAKDLYLNAKERLNRITEERANNRKVFIDAKRKKKGQFVWTSFFPRKLKEDETDSETAARILDNCSSCWDLPEALVPRRYGLSAEICAKYLTLFDKGVEFFIDDEDLRYLS